MKCVVVGSVPAMLFIPWECHQVLKLPATFPLEADSDSSRSPACLGEAGTGAFSNQEFLNFLVQQREALILIAVSGFCCNIKADDANT